MVDRTISLGCPGAQHGLRARSSRTDGGCPGCGMVGDAIALEIADGDLIAPSRRSRERWWRTSPAPPMSGWCRFAPGSCPCLLAARTPPRCRSGQWTGGRVRVVSRRRDDDVEVLARAEMVIGVGAAVPPDEYALLSPLAALLRCRVGGHPEGDRQRVGATLSAGWHHRPKHCSSSLRGVGPSGKFNHVVGVRGAGTILAINHDPEALVFGHCDIGIVGDWHEVLPVLVASLRRDRTVKPSGGGDPRCRRPESSGTGRRPPPGGSPKPRHSQECGGSVARSLTPASGTIPACLHSA